MNNALAKFIQLGCLAFIVVIIVLAIVTIVAGSCTFGLVGAC